MENKLIQCDLSVEEFEEQPIIGELDPEEVPFWSKIVAVHYSDGDIQHSDLDNVSVDCSIEAFKENLDFYNMDNIFDLWASTLPLCAMGQVGP